MPSKYYTFIIYPTYRIIAHHRLIVDWFGVGVFFVSKGDLKYT